MANEPGSMTYVYISSADSNQIQIYTMDRQTGALSPAGRIAVPGENTGTPIVSVPMSISADRRLLFAAVRFAPFPVSSYSIDPANGQLTLLGTAPLPDSMAYIAATPNGRTLLAASYPGNLLSVSRIADNGHVESPPMQIMQPIPNAHAIMIDRSGHFVYVPSLGGDRIFQYRLDSETGHVTPLDPPSVATAQGSGPRHIALHPHADILYCVNELDGAVDTYALDSKTGRLSHLHNARTIPKGQMPPPPSLEGIEEASLPYASLFHAGTAGAADIHVTPDGRFLYASVRANATIYGYAIGAPTAPLKPIGTWPTEICPRALRIDPRGRFLLAAGQGSGKVAISKIDPATGMLTRIGEVKTDRNPAWIEIIDL